jgi:hypothetical protein
VAACRRSLGVCVSTRFSRVSELQHAPCLLLTTSWCRVRQPATASPAVHRCFEGTCCFHVQDRRVGQATEEQEAGCTVWCLVQALLTGRLLLGLHFNGASSFHRKVTALLPDYTASYLRGVCSSTAVILIYYQNKVRAQKESRT